jgi:CBS domain-containing protein
MPIVVTKTILKGLLVSEAMRRQVISLSKETTIDSSINHLIKYKVNALLTTDEANRPVGVVSKTDIMGAYYADLPPESPLEHIMSSPPLFCRPQDSLESALDKMRSKGIYRLYACEPDSERIVGVLAYPDIVGLLYRYCHSCEYSILGKRRKDQDNDSVPRFKVREVMTPAVKAFGEDESLLQVMEGLSVYRFGAVLITDRNNIPSGVVSKTDLILTYKHGIPSDIHAKAIMSSPVRSCEESEFLEDAIQTMIFSEVHRLFVHQGAPQNIVGVLSLSDAARLRSGSCHACISSRIKVDDHN